MLKNKLVLIPLASFKREIIIEAIRRREQLGRCVGEGELKII
jgi:hypothetical protein